MGLSLVNYYDVSRKEYTVIINLRRQDADVERIGIYSQRVYNHSIFFSSTPIVKK